MGNIRKLACSQHFAQRYCLVLFFLLHGADADEQRIHAQIWLTQLFHAGLHLPQRPFIVPILPAHLLVLHAIQCFAVLIFQGQLIKEGLSSYHLTQPQVTADARLYPLPVLPVFILYLRPSFLKHPDAFLMFSLCKSLDAFEFQEQRSCSCFLLYERIQLCLGKHLSAAHLSGELAEYPGILDPDKHDEEKQDDAAKQRVQ